MKKTIQNAKQKKVNLLIASGCIVFLGLIFFAEQFGYVNIRGLFSSASSDLQGLNAELQTASLAGVSPDQTRQLVEKFRSAQNEFIAIHERQPKNIQSYLVSPAIWNKLPADLQMVVPQMANKTGYVQKIHLDEPKTKTSTFTTTFTDSKTKQSYFLSNLGTLDKSVVTGNLYSSEIAQGLSIGGRIYLAKGGLKTNLISENNLSGSGLPPRTSNRFPRRLAIIVFDAGKNTSVITPQFIKGSLIDGGDNERFFSENLGAKNIFDGDVYGTYKVNSTARGCMENIDTWTQLAEQYAAKDGFDINRYQHLMYVFPQSDCPFAGMAQANSFSPLLRSWIIADSSPDFFNYVIRHELGHNFGLLHAAGIHCPNDNYGEGSGCDTWEYGDGFDSMGHGQRINHFSNYHKTKLGVLGKNSQVITQSGRYTLRAQELPGTTVPQALIIRRKGAFPHPFFADEKNSYILEYRTNFGLDNVTPEDEASKGVMIRIGADLEMNKYGHVLNTYLVEPYGYSPELAPYTVGESFADEYTGVAIYPVSVSKDQMVIDIDITPRQ